jgi:hypothetical protein
VAFDDPNLVSPGGMVAGANSIDDMALLRHGGMGRTLARAYAPSTLGSFLRAFTFSHVRQFDAIACPIASALWPLVHTGAWKDRISETTPK